MWTRFADETVVDTNGKIIHFGEKRFLDDICRGNCCFICGATPTEKRFNDEHVFPEWLLRRLDLFDKSIALPNRATVRYDRYTVPCCADCNTLMGNQIEIPISQAFEAGLAGLVKLLDDDPLAVSVWMRLIFIKLYLKDRTMRFHLDARRGEGKIGELYEWEKLHFTHAFARCFYSGSEVNRATFGSTLIVPVTPRFSAHRFDFGDNLAAQTVLLRLNNVGVLSVFNDCGGVMGLMQERLGLITAPVSDLQLRELFVEMAWLNIHLKDRPSFKIDIDPTHEVSRITCDLPPSGPDLKELDYGLRGRLYNHCLGDVFQDDATTLEAIRAGQFTLLFDPDGRFIDHADAASDQPSD